jgi:hypothetical protein
MSRRRDTGKKVAERRRSRKQIRSTSQGSAPPFLLSAPQLTASASAGSNAQRSSGW